MFHAVGQNDAQQHAKICSRGSLVVLQLLEPSRIPSFGAFGFPQYFAAHLAGGWLAGLQKVRSVFALTDRLSVIVGECRTQAIFELKLEHLVLLLLRLLLE